MQEGIDGAAIGVDVVVDDVDFHALAAGEEVDQVVDRLLELSAAAGVVVGRHRAAALKVDGEREVLETIGGDVPRHGWPQLASHLVDVLAQSVHIDFSALVEKVAILVGVAFDDGANGVVGHLCGVAVDECLLDGLLQAATAARGHCHAGNQCHHHHHCPSACSAYFVHCQ